MRLARLLLVLPFLVIPAAAPGQAEAACKSDTKAFVYADTISKNSIEMQATKHGQTLLFKTNDGQTVGGAGARLKIDENRILGTLSTRGATIVVRGNPKKGQVVATAVVRKEVKPPIRVGRNRVVTSKRTTYTMDVASGRQLEIRCG